MKELSTEKGLPKHLFPLGDETSTSRLVRQLTPFSKKIFCIVNPGQKELFQKYIDNESANIIEKKEGLPFISDFKTVLEQTKKDVLITTGDLVFEDEDIQEFLSSIVGGKTIIVTDNDLIKKGFPIRIALLRREIIEKICKNEVNPEKISSILSLLIGDILKGGFPKIKKITTLANLNTPEDYDSVLKHFPSTNETR